MSWTNFFRSKTAYPRRSRSSREIRLLVLEQVSVRDVTPELPAISAAVWHQSPKCQRPPLSPSGH